MKIAWLVYKPYKKRNKKNTFDSNYNIGALLINDILGKNYIIDYVTPESAFNTDILLVSFTSTYDLLSYYKAVNKYKHFKNRKFKVIAGGFGLQNIYGIKDFIDVAVFGRAENIINEVIKGNYNFNNIMVLPEIKDVEIGQTKKLYPNEIKTKGYKLTWKEQFIGCPNKCKFCHYTWSRKCLYPEKTYYQGSLTKNNSVEILWKDIKYIDKKQGHIRTAIDGFSERLRYKYGKKITNDSIIEGIEKIGSYDGKTIMLIYNISNMPNETEEDYQELITTIGKAKPKNRVIIVLQSTPFRPSPLTPMQWHSVKLFPNWNDLAGKVIIERKNLRFIHSFSNESCWSQLLTSIIERATETSDHLINTILYNRKLDRYRAEDKVKILLDNFDLSHYIKKYNHDEKIPTWYLHSYTEKNNLINMAKRLGN